MYEPWTSLINRDKSNNNTGNNCTTITKEQKIDNLIIRIV